MFIPKSFQINDKQEIYAFIQANAFGQLISNKENRLLSSHLPFLLSDDKTKLIGHLAKVNPQEEDLHDEQVLITLHGAHDYISPSWYEGAGVPTWNYQAVHIYGEYKVFNEPKALKEVVDALTAKYESGFKEPWQPNYRAAMLGGIVGFEVTISDIQAAYKLSQNKSETDRNRIIQELESLGSNDLATAMKRV